MKFLRGSHTEGYFDHVQSSQEGNGLNENQDMVSSPDNQSRDHDTRL